MLTLLIAASVVVGGAVVNGDFESKGKSKTDVVVGWTVDTGATNGALEPVSQVELDTKEKHGGKQSLHFIGKSETRRWLKAAQEVEARPGGKYRLSAFAKTKGVVREGPQFDNCHVSLFFFDALGEVVGKDYRALQKPDSPWTQLEITLEAPETTRSAKVFAFLSQTGELWLDDVELSIEGGAPVPEPALVFNEEFEKATDVPSEWVEQVGAHNGTGGARSTISIDKKSGAGTSKRSLHFAGSADTIQWYDLTRSIPVQPGDLMCFSANLKADNVRKEGVQFANLHIRLAFQDDAGKLLGAARFSDPGLGSYEWKPQEVRGVAPEGATRVVCGAFLSMSGDAWFDDLKLTRQSGSRAAYSGWLTFDAKHVSVRYPDNHPRKQAIAEYAARLDTAYESIRAALEVDYQDKITVYLYSDNEQGKALTGQPLAFANPEGRAVHQTMHNTIGHELTHVIALKLGYAQTTMLGEGLGVWLDGEGPDFHHKRAAELLKAGTLPSIKAMLTDFRAEKDGYPAAGSLCGFLIATYGLEKFERLYAHPSTNEFAKELLGSSLEDLDANWREILGKQG